MSDPMRGLLPSEKAEAKSDAEIRLKQLAAQRTAMLREDFGRTFGTEHGKRVLAFICQRAGYNKSKVAAMVDGAVNKDMTVFLAQEETFYLEIRKHIPIDILKQVEYGDQIKPSGTIEETQTVNTKRKPNKKKG